MVLAVAVSTWDEVMYIRRLKELFHCAVLLRRQTKPRVSSTLLAVVYAQLLLYTSRIAAIAACNEGTCQYIQYSRRYTCYPFTFL